MVMNNLRETTGCDNYDEYLGPARNFFVEEPEETKYDWNIDL